MKKFIYKDNYSIKVVLILLVAVLLCVIKEFKGFVLIQMPVADVSDYHSNILTINSIFSGFALTNLGILLSISDDQLIKKLEGTDILMKRNIVIAHSIIFGAISIFVSLVFLLDINFAWVRCRIIETVWGFWIYLLFNVEILTLCVSIFYFILSIKKMIELLSHIYIPRPKLSDEVVEALKDKLNKK